MMETIYSKLQLFSCKSITIVFFMFILTSCDHDDVDKLAAPADFVQLSVSTPSLCDVSVEKGTRSSAKMVKPTKMSLGKNLKMEISLVPDVTANTRASSSSALAKGVKFRVIAFKKGNISSSGYIAYGDFTVGGSSTLSTFKVPAGNYTFVCYSLNSKNTLFSFDKTSLDYTFANNSSTDLLYYQFDQNITKTNNQLSIKMKHLCSKVTIMADSKFSGHEISAIGDVTLSPIYKPKLSLSGGVLSSNGTTSLTLNWGNVSKGYTQTTASSWIYTGSSKPVITLSSIKIGKTTKKNLSVNIGATLEAGKSYTLKLVFTGIAVFAGSNIYRGDDGKLTFDDAGVTTHSHYQGLAYRFGSLYGEPLVLELNRDKDGKRIKETNNTMVTAYNGSTKLWRSNYLGIYGDGVQTLYWLSTSYSASSTKNVLYNLSFSKNPSAYYYRGDICKLITQYGDAPDSPNGWRLPTGEEFGSASAYTKVGSFKEITDDVSYYFFDGTKEIDSGYTYLGNFFPASGERGGSDHYLYKVGVWGIYRTGSVYKSGSDGFVYGLFFTDEEVLPQANLDRDYPKSVRCVRN